jgi:hypothetical protein
VEDDQGKVMYAAAWQVKKGEAAQNTSLTVTLGESLDQKHYKKSTKRGHPAKTVLPGGVVLTNRKQVMTYETFEKLADPKQQPAGDISNIVKKSVTVDCSNQIMTLFGGQKLSITAEDIVRILIVHNDS